MVCFLTNWTCTYKTTGYWRPSQTFICRLGTVSNSFFCLEWGILFTEDFTDCGLVQAFGIHCHCHFQTEQKPVVLSLWSEVIYLNHSTTQTHHSLIAFLLVHSSNIQMSEQRMVGSESEKCVQVARNFYPQTVVSLI